MPVCKLLQTGDQCVLDNNIYWDDLDQESKDKCKQQLNQCGPLIGQNVGQAGGRRRTRRRHSRRARKSRQSRRR